MNKYGRLFERQIIKPGLHDNLLALTNSEGDSLGLFVNLTLNRIRLLGFGIIKRPADDPPPDSQQAG